MNRIVLAGIARRSLLESAAGLGAGAALGGLLPRAAKENGGG